MSIIGDGSCGVMEMWGMKHSTTGIDLIRGGKGGPHEQEHCYDVDDGKRYQCDADTCDMSCTTTAVIPYATTTV